MPKGESSHTPGVPNAMVKHMQKKQVLGRKHYQEEVMMVGGYFWDDVSYGVVLEQATQGLIHVSDYYFVTRDAMIGIGRRKN